MKLIIAGSRSITVSVEEIQTLIDIYHLKPTSIVSGQAIGVDTCGEQYADVNNLPIIPFPVTREDWDRIGKSAGHVRNKKMAIEADVLLLIWDGKSSGSAGMKQIMTEMKKPVFEGIVEPIIDVSKYKITIGAKVAYVKSQGQTRNHHCHWPNCDKNVPPAQWGCKEHWFKLPKKLRDKIWVTYNPGQEINGTPSKSYLYVADEVQKWIKANT